MMKLKDLDFEHYILYPQDYYYEFFSMINLIDLLVDNLFNNGEVTYDFSAWNNKDLIVPFINTLFERIETEHYQVQYSHDMSNNVLTLKLTYRHKDNNFYGSCDDKKRQTGRSTRLANEYIQTMFRDGKVIIYDHFHNYYTHMETYGLPSVQLPDKYLFNKINQRIDREFPAHIKRLISSDRRNILCFNRDGMEGKYKINYRRFSL